MVSGESAVSGTRRNIWSLDVLVSAFIGTSAWDSDGGCNFSSMYYQCKFGYKRARRLTRYRKLSSFLEILCLCEVEAAARICTRIARHQIFGMIIHLQFHLH